MELSKVLLYSYYGGNERKLRKGENVKAVFITDILCVAMQFLTPENLSSAIIDYIFDTDIPRPCQWFPGRKKELEQLHVLLIIDNFNVTATQGQFLDLMPVFLLAEVYTHDIKLKKRIRKYAEKYPELCQLTDDDGQGGLWFEINKRRISIRLTAPYTDDCHKAVSKLKKEKRNP